MNRKHLLHFLWAAPLVLLAPFLFAGFRMYYGTVSLQFVPWRWLAAEMLALGELPLWNPLSAFGAPLLANYQSAFLYPLHWLLLPFARLGGVDGLAWAHGALVWVHLGLAGWGMARLVRALGLGVLPQALAGLAFGLSGYMVARAHFLSINATAAWLPWVLLAVYRVVVGERGAAHRGALGLAGATALLLLAGHAQTAWYALLLAGAWGLFWLLQTAGGAAHSHNHRQDTDSAVLDRPPPALPLRSRAGLLLAGVVIGGLIAAVQLLPTLELLLQSQRAGGADEAFVMTYSFWPWRLLGFFLPGLYGSPATGNFWGYATFWEDAVYIGLLPVFLALRALLKNDGGDARRRLVFFLAGVTLISLILAFGQNTPIFPWLYRNVPTFNLFQAPARYSIWAVFALSLLAGIGAQSWAGSVSSYSRHLAARWTSVGLAFVLAGVLILMFLPEIEPSFGRSALATGLVGTFAAALGLTRRRGTPWQAAVLLLVSLDLLSSGWGLNPAASRSLYTSPAPNAAALRDRLGDGRLYLFQPDGYRLTFDKYFSLQSYAVDLGGLRSSLLPNLNLLDSISSANQFDPLVPARYAAWLDLVESSDGEKQTWLLAQSGVAVLERYREDMELRFTTQDAAPRAQWYPCGLPAAGPEEAMVQLLAQFPDPVPLPSIEPGEAGLPNSCDPQPAGKKAAGEADIVAASGRRVVIRTEAAGDGWLVLRDTAYPGWEASVDGDEVRTYTANGLFRAVPVPAGAHEVEWVYAPASFSIGLLISAAGAALLSAAWYFVSRRRA